MPYTVYLRTQADAAIAAAVAALVNSSPATLDTLKELADALGDDANFATTMTNALAGKQPLDSDLTAIAALTTTTFGRSLLTAADAAGLRTLSGALAASVVGAANGVAGLDANGHINYAAMAPGSVFHVTSPDGGTTWKDLLGNTISARPTARTDLRMVCESTGTALPAFAITGDLLFKIS